MPATNSSRTKLGSGIQTITTSIIISSSKLRKHLYSSCDLWFFWNTIYNHTNNQGGFIFRSVQNEFAWVRFGNSLDICFSEKNVFSLNIKGVVCYFPELNFFWQQFLEDDRGVFQKMWDFWKTLSPLLFAAVECETECVTSRFLVICRSWKQIFEGDKSFNEIFFLRRSLFFSLALAICRSWKQDRVRHQQLPQLEQSCQTEPGGK